MKWKPIFTAPKDGTEILACRMTGAVPEMEMRVSWDANRESVWVPGVVGMWVDKIMGMTWAEETDFGPTHWSPLQ